MKRYQIEDNCEVEISDQFIIIKQGRKNINIAFLYFISAFFLLGIVMLSMINIFFLLLLILPVIIILWAFTYVVIEINLSESKVLKCFQFNTQKILTFKPISLNINNISIKENTSEELGLDQSTIDYILKCDDHNILYFNSFKTASNVQKIINNKTNLTILYK